MSHFSVAVIMKDGGCIDDMLAPYQENNMGDCPKQYLKFYEDEDGDIDLETGKRGYWENPNRKWDWWTVGGRWRDFFKTKSGQKVNDCKICDLDASLDESRKKRAERIWEVVIEGEPQKPDENSIEFHYKPDFYKRVYGDKETYIKNSAGNYPFAFITPDGLWHEQGSMGWFGIHDSTLNSLLKYMSEWERALAEASPNDIVVIVDCHI